MLEQTSCIRDWVIEPLEDRKHWILYLTGSGDGLDWPLGLIPR